MHYDRTNRHVEWPNGVAKSTECSRLHKHHEAKGNPDTGKEQVLLSGLEGSSFESLHPQKRFREDDQCNVYHDRENKHQRQAIAQRISGFIDVSRADGPCNEGACGGRDGHRHRANRKD